MKQITREWVSKAEADFGTARREFDVTGDRNYDAVCFHGQQCAEKYLKARLQEADIAFMRTHDLTVLLDLVVVIEPAWESLRAELHQLTAFAVESRYPGETSDASEAKQSLETAAKVRQIARQSLGL